MGGRGGCRHICWQNQFSKAMLVQSRNNLRCFFFIFITFILSCWGEAFICIGFKFKDKMQTKFWGNIYTIAFFKGWATSIQNSLFLFAPIPSNFFILYWSWFYTHTVKCCRRWTGWVSRLQCWCGRIIRVAIQICHIGHSPLARG